MIVGFSSIIVAIIVGGLLGAISGYYGGKVDNILMRLMDILMAIPGMLLAISLAAVLKPGLMNLVIAIAHRGSPGLRPRGPSFRSDDQGSGIYRGSHLYRRL